jgi:hypothetical protein
MAITAITLHTVEKHLNEDLLEKIATTVHSLKVECLHEEMAMELLFFKEQSPVQGLKKMFPNLVSYVHILDQEDELMDSTCIMDRVVVYKLNDTDIIVLSQFTGCLYHSAYYRMNHHTKMLLLLKSKSYSKQSGYDVTDGDCALDFVCEALNINDYTFSRGYCKEDKWLLGGAMINWLIAAKNEDLGL